MKKKPSRKKLHRWGPVAEVGKGSLMTGCEALGCDMTLSVDDVPHPEYQTAAEFLTHMKQNADRSFPCPFVVEKVAARILK